MNCIIVDDEPLARDVLQTSQPNCGIMKPED